MKAVERERRAGVRDTWQAARFELDLNWDWR